MQIGQGILTIKNIQQVLSSRVFLGRCFAWWLAQPRPKKKRILGADFLEFLQRFLKGHPERTKDIRAQPFLGNWNVQFDHANQSQVETETVAEDKLNSTIQRE